MTARAIIAPLSFGDSSLPKINLAYTRPVPGAVYDWAVNQLPAGPLTQWASLVDGTPLTADGASPVVMGEGKSRALTFNGTSSRMRAQFRLAGAQSIVAVYRFVTPKPLDTVHFGLSNAEGGSLGIPGDGSTTRASTATTALFPTPPVVPDSNWHISVVTVDGERSALRIDGVETGGNLAVGTRDGLTLGFSGATGNRAAIHYKRVAIVPGSMSSAQRAAIVNQMIAEYVS